VFYVARIKREIEPGADTDLDDATFCSGHDATAVGSEISLAHRHINQQWNDLFLVEVHLLKAIA